MWVKLQDVIVAQNTNKVISPQINADVIKPGDGIYINNVNQAMIEVQSVANGELILARNWTFSDVVDGVAQVTPLTGDFRQAAEALDEATAVTQQNFAALEDFYTQMGTVTFTDYDGSTHTVRTMKQIEADVSKVARTETAIRNSANAVAELTVPGGISQYDAIRFLVGVGDPTNGITDPNLSFAEVIEIPVSQIKTNVVRYIKLCDHQFEDGIKPIGSTSGIRVRRLQVYINTQSTVENIVRCRIDKDAFFVNAGILAAWGINY